MHNLSKTELIPKVRSGSFSRRHQVAGMMDSLCTPVCERQARPGASGLARWRIGTREDVDVTTRGFYKPCGVPAFDPCDLALSPPS